MHLRLRKWEKLPQTYRKLADLQLRNTSCSFAEFVVAELSVNLRCPGLHVCDQPFCCLAVLEINWQHYVCLYQQP